MLSNLCSDFTLKSLIDWLDTRYLTRSYPYIDSYACLRSSLNLVASLMSHSTTERFDFQAIPTLFH
jgi:hypothetical protein